MTMSLPHVLAQKGKVYDIRNYGAVADSFTVNTRFIQQAIDEASKNGGRVLVPQGTFVTGTLILKSGVELHLEKGALLLGSSSLDDYPPQQITRDFYGKEWKNKALIFAQKQSNISITGLGTIDGRGHFFWPSTDQKPDRYFNRPYVLFLVECKQVTVKDIRLRNSAYWMQHYMACSRLRIEGIHVYNHANQNNDGLDVDGCEDVLIRDVEIDSDDDALCFKSLSPSPCKHIRVRRVTLSSHCNAFKLGTESTGGFLNFNVRKVEIKPSRDTIPHFGSRNGDGGIALQIVDGGIMRDIRLHDFNIKGPRSPLSVRLGNRARPYSASQPSPQQGSIEQIRLKRIKAVSYDSLGSYIMATEQGRINDIEINHFEQEIRPGSAAVECIEEEKSTAYPEGKMHGSLPAFGLYVHKVDQLSLRNCRFSTTGKVMEQRKPIVYFQTSFRSIKKLYGQGKLLDAKLWPACKGR